LLLRRYEATSFFFDWIAMSGFARPKLILVNLYDGGAGQAERERCISTAIRSLGMKRLFVLSLFAGSLLAQTATVTWTTAHQTMDGFGVPDDSAVWSALYIHDFVLKNLGPTFSSNSLTTKIMIPESSTSQSRGSMQVGLAALAHTTMNDASAAAFVGIIADHDYHSICQGTDRQVTYSNGGMPLWQTEVSNLANSLGCVSPPNGPGVLPFDASMSTALFYATDNRNNMQHTVTVWHWWSYRGNAWQSLIDPSTGNTSKTLWVMGQWSRFVRPGWQRIDAIANPSSGGVYVTPFKNSSTGAYVIAAVNTNRTASSQTFGLTNLPSTTTVTPDLTDAIPTKNIVAQGSAIVAGGTFAPVTLGANSVTTFVGTAQSVPVTVNWTTVHQTMDGFAGQTLISGTSLSDAQADLFFSPTGNLGLAYVRTANIDCNWTGTACSPQPTYPDLVTLQKAVARGVKVYLSLQSPPSALKAGSTNTYCYPPSSTITDVNGYYPFCGGSLAAFDATHYSQYAVYIVQQINYLKSQGVQVDTLGVQNEPNIASASYGASTWTAAQFDAFVPYLGLALTNAGLSSVRVELGAYSGWFDGDLVSTTLNDGTAAPYISTISGHGYGSGTMDGTGVSYCCHDATLPPSAVQTWMTASANHHLWMAEVNGGWTQEAAPCDTTAWVWDATMDDALVWARSIHDYFTIANASGWFYWQLITTGGPGSPDSCTSSSGYNDAHTSLASDSTLLIGKRYYTIGQWSKFVRPGWQRIDATAKPVSGVYTTAFKNPSTGDYAIVAINNNGSASPLTFGLTAFPSTSMVTPYLTSASANLAPQAPMTVYGASFNATLAPQSVTTFVGTAGGSPPCTISPPAIGPYSIGQSVFQQFTTFNCTSSSFAISSGSLNGSGLTLSASGLLSGTAVGGSFSFTVAYGGATDPLTLTIRAPTLSPCDINQDGVVNSIDVNLANQQALGTSACTVDLDKDNVCTVVDVQRVINAALGGACISQ
jgi:glucuronoarabinoxylan endo-1,4-beta-xylanase